MCTGMPLGEDTAGVMSQVSAVDLFPPSRYCTGGDKPDLPERNCCSKRLTLGSNSPQAGY
uniref:Uncharacterized protein n=1 Tax=Anguilla anguilla TaxID=7936 RepID=A0A0E9SSG7_ANGAN